MNYYRGKNVLIISPQPWETIHISKHHYALELTRKGATVYFLNPPDDATTKAVVRTHPDWPALHIVDYCPPLSYSLRFHARWLYDVMMHRAVQHFLRRFTLSFDVVWCFDTSLYTDLRWFGNGITIYHPVDQVYYPSQLRIAASADFILAPSTAILDCFEEYSTPRYFLNHGLSEAFVNDAYNAGIEPEHVSERIQVGYVGNLFIDCLDRTTFRHIIASHPELSFHVWGPCSVQESNIGASAVHEALDFIHFLEDQPHVILHGKLPPQDIAKALQQMDVLLVCYDVEKDVNRVSNSHKIMEYLSTGKVVVANYTATYTSLPGLLNMVDEPSNARYSERFSDTIAHLDVYNHPDRQRERINFALGNSYDKHLDHIEAWIMIHGSQKSPR